MQTINLFMISAMYENGGNTIHRMLDGHPQLFTYPAESQLGTHLVADFQASYVPYKYRWPEFPMNGSFEQDYELIFDEEVKTFLRAPSRSKFRIADAQMSESDRRSCFLELLRDQPRTRANIVHAFFRATFDAWKNLKRSGSEVAFLGYSPVLVLDAERIREDFPHGHIIHVVRNPYSAYADTKKRPFPLGLNRYIWTWNYCQLLALTYAQKFPENFHIVRFEDAVANPQEAFGQLLFRLGLPYSDTVLWPSWNGQRLETVYPWGTIRTPTTDANLATMNELSEFEKKEIRSLSAVVRPELGYGDW